MEAPKCRLCGDAHWSSERCKTAVNPRQSNKPKDLPRAVNHDVNTQQATIDALRARIAELESENAALKAGKPKFDRKAYMREYMQRRRGKDEQNQIGSRQSAEK